MGWGFNGPTARPPMSPGYDTMIQSAVDRRNLPALLAALPLLKELDPQLIGELATEIAWFSIPGGVRLYSAGEVADSLYVIVNGAFGIYANQPRGGSLCIGTLSAGRIAAWANCFESASSSFPAPWSGRHRTPNEHGRARASEARRRLSPSCYG